MKHFAFPDLQNVMIGRKYHDIKNKKGKKLYTYWENSYICRRKALFTLIIFCV